MATFSGKAGIIRISAATVAEIVDWSVTIENAPMEDTALADNWPTYVSGGGNRNLTGQCTVRWDDTDTNGQTALESAVTGDTDVSMDFLPEGGDTGAYEIAATVRVTNMEITASRDAPIGRTFSFTGNGAPTIGTSA